MECIATSYAPLIVEPDSTHHDWTKQHVFSEQLRQAEHKQAVSTNTNTTTTNNTNNTKRPSLHHHNHQNPPPPSKRQRHQNTLLLHIPGPTSRVHKYIVTPTKKTPTMPAQHWADLLHSATATLQSVYASMPAPPAAPKAAPMPSTTPRPEFGEGLDRVQLASRAMQMAAGFALRRGRGDEEEDDDSSSSSGSESEVEAPATPVGVCEGVMMDIDPQLFS